MSRLTRATMLLFYAGKNLYKEAFREHPVIMSIPLIGMLLCILTLIVAREEKEKAG